MLVVRQFKVNCVELCKMPSLGLTVRVGVLGTSAETEKINGGNIINIIVLVLMAMA